MIVVNYIFCYFVCTMLLLLQWKIFDLQIGEEKCDEQIVQGLFIILSYSVRQGSFIFPIDEICDELFRLCDVIHFQKISLFLFCLVLEKLLTTWDYILSWIGPCHFH